jgi:hypothetical protein
VGRVTFGQSVLTVRLALWDETRQKLISFREATRLRRAVAAQ